MGYKPAYFSQTANGATIGDGFIDKMCSAFGFRFTISDGDKRSTKPEPDESRAAILERIAKAQEEQGVLLQTLTKLILAKLDK